MSLVEKPIVTTAANTNDKSPVRKVRIDDAAAFEEVQALLENDYPAVKVSAVDVDGDTILNADEGGMRVFWIYEGRGKVFLPKGYRTQEGGRGRLPDEYQPDPIDPTVADVLDRLEAGQASLS